MPAHDKRYSCKYCSNQLRLPLSFKPLNKTPFKTTPQDLCYDFDTNDESRNQQTEKLLDKLKSNLSNDAEAKEGNKECRVCLDNVCNVAFSCGHQSCTACGYKSSK